MLPLVAICTGAFAFTITLWATGFGATATDTTARLSRLRGREAPSAGATPGAGVSLRKRASVRLGGVNLVSLNLATRWALQLERAGLMLNVREYFILRALVSFALVAVALVISPVPYLALAGAPLGFLLVGFFIKRRTNSRKIKLEGQLVELLQMVSSGLRAGFGLQQSLEAATDQVPAPLATELRRTMRDMGMGASIDGALTALNDRIGSADFDIVITAILIQRAVGGNLAEILDNVAHTMRERERIRGEIRTLTSQQRLTGYVIGGIPIGLAAAFFLISPDYMSLLFTESLGQALIGGALVLESMGFLVIRKIVNIEV